MTAVDDRLITDATEIFRRLEVPEWYKAELLRGNIVMTAGPDVVHNRIVQDVQDQIPRQVGACADSGCRHSRRDQ